jgi:hypothetical protein
MDQPTPRKLGFRFEKGHPFYPPKQVGSEHTRLRSKIIRRLKREYGPDISAKQMEHIVNAADIRARLHLQGETINHADYVLLVNTERRELAEL